MTGLDGQLYFIEKDDNEDKFKVNLLEFNESFKGTPYKRDRINIENVKINNYLTKHHKQYSEQMVFMGPEDKKEPDAKK